MSSPTPTTWFDANRDYLERQLKRLRLLLQRRVAWLRTQWQHDPLQPYQGLVISDPHADRLLQGEDHSAVRRFFEVDDTAARMTRQIVDAERELAATCEASRHVPAAELLAETFRLSPFERDVLLLCLAPELDSSFAQLFAYVQDDANRRYVTPQLATTLLAADRYAMSEAFRPGGPLRQFRLVTLPTGSAELRLDERIADYLRGVNRFDQRVALMLRPLGEGLLAAEHRAAAEGVVAALDLAEGSDSWPVVNLVGPAGAGRQIVADAVCRRLGRRPMILDARKLPEDAEALHERTGLIAREAALLQLAVYLDVDDLEDERRGGPEPDDLIRWLDAPLLLASRRRWQSERETIVVDVPWLSPSAQQRLWRQALDGVAPAMDGVIDDIVQQFDLGPRAIRNAVRSACSNARLGNRGGLSPEDLWQACRDQGTWRLSALARRIVPCHNWRDIVAPDKVLQQLREIAAQVAHRATVYERWGFAERLNRSRGITALFCGPSGTGKTMAAEILAHHLQLDLYRIDLAGVISKYIGETEKNLRNVFEAAEQSGAVLFFDEADALFGKRTEVKDSHDRYANIEVNYLLQRMEDYRGLAILATNRKSDLDRAFLRRLRFLVDFPFPDAQSRQRIWEQVFPARAPVADLDFAALSRMEIAGGNIKTISLNAAFLAADNDTPIGMQEVMQAARREYDKIDKLTSEAELGTFAPRRNRRRGRRSHSDRNGAATPPGGARSTETAAGRTG